METPRKFITAKLSIRKPGSSSHIISTDEDPGLRIESFAVIFTWCFHKQNNYNVKNILSPIFDWLIKAIRPANKIRRVVVFSLLYLFGFPESFFVLKS